MKGYLVVTKNKKYGMMDVLYVNADYNDEESAKKYINAEVSDVLDVVPFEWNFKPKKYAAYESKEDSVEVPEERMKAFLAINSERDYQDKLWSESGSNGDGVLSIGEQILLIEEYAAKARQSWSQEKNPETGALDIMRKIAGIAVHCMEDHGAINR